MQFLNSNIFDKTRSHWFRSLNFEGWELANRLHDCLRDTWVRAYRRCWAPGRSKSPEIFHGRLVILQSQIAGDLHSDLDWVERILSWDLSGLAALRHLLSWRLSVACVSFWSPALLKFKANFGGGHAARNLSVQSIFDMNRALIVMSISFDFWYLVLEFGWLNLREILFLNQGW